MSDIVDRDSPVPLLPRGTSKDFLVVGLGGSAGAITSFREFFRNVPRESGMAYVVILHLSPEHESRLAEVLQGSTAIPVRQIRESAPLEANHVYVIPPNKSLTVRDGSLMLSEINTVEERRAPVDIFFRTLADHLESRAVSVIMSGSGSDGSMGLRRIKEFNGLVLVQDPSEAAFGEMPRNSIATGLVDFVVPAAEMPRRIISYRDRLKIIHIPEPSEERSDEGEQELAEILTLLRIRTGHDFSSYKRATVLRRIERRLAVHEITTLSHYVRFLRDHPQEAHALVRELLISVTNFFRDPEVWERVEKTVIPRMVEQKRAVGHLRIWVPGCATGEEAYSIAMLLAERPSLPEVQIFATDLDQHAIARARNACYSDADVADVSPERLRRFFTRDPDGYQIRREIREMVLFAHHNLIKDPPFSHLDMVSCRNLLIYLNRDAQQRALELLHFALEPDGYLLLGTAESADAAANLFKLLDKETHLYQGRAVPRVVNPPQAMSREPRLAGGRLEHRNVERTSREPIAAIDIHHRLLEQYAPPSLIVDADYEIVHLSERAGHFLQFPGGEASTNLLQVIRPELRTEVRSALFQAAQKRTAVVAPRLTIHNGERAEMINLIVKPAFSERDPAGGYFLILFEQERNHAAPAVAERAALDPAARQIEEELMHLKSQMRSTIEQYEIQAEEAQAANEELQAMNEELRSTAEELETSQEELQSVNEELQTLNQELKVKIEEIGHANDDLRNLMSSTEIGTIFVDRSMRVKLFTPRAREVFNLIAGDVGRPLLDITSRLRIDGLTEEVERVLDRLTTIEREVDTRDGAWYLMRLLPYRTADDRIDGVVITFLDITQRKEAEERLREGQEQLQERVRERTRELEALSASRQQLLERLVTVTEEERQRIARELHDQMGQHLTALRISLQSLSADQETVQRMTRLVDDIDRSIDRLTMELRPPVLDDVGLEGAVAVLVEQFTATSGVPVDVHIDGIDGTRLPDTIETTIYRVLQEALTNIVKHAGARGVSVIVKRHEGQVHLIVEDDGKGFESVDSSASAAGRFGLIGMRERVSLIGGSFSIESADGGGTAVYARVPVRPKT